MYCQQSDVKCLKYFLFIVFLLLCYMKCLNGKLGYIAQIIFYWCCSFNYFYFYNTVKINCNSNAVCSLKRTYFWPQQVPLCAVFRFNLFVYFLFTWWLVHAHVLLGVLTVCTHIICTHIAWSVSCVHTQHAHVMLGMLAVCTHTTCTCTAWCVRCMYTHNMHMYCLVC